MPSRRRRQFHDIPILVLRRERQLTLEQVAQVVGTNNGNLSRIERGIQRAGPDLAERIAKFYRVPELVVLYPERYMTDKATSA